MPRYFFDFHDGELTRDEEGTECSDLEAVKLEAKQALPDIAKMELPEDGEDHVVKLLVRDETGRRVYEASLTFRGTVFE